METLIDVTFRGLTQDQAANLFAAIRHDYQGPQPVSEPAVAPVVPDTTTVVETTTDAPKKRGRPRKAAPVQTDIEDEIAAAKDHTPSRSGPAQAGASSVEPAGESAAGTSPTLNDVRTALSSLMARKGEPACRAVLEQFGAARISLLLQEQYEAFIKECGK